MKIDTQETIKALDGKDIKSSDGDLLKVGVALSNVLLSAKEGGKMKMFVLAQRLFEEESVEVDVADLALIKSACEKCELYTTLVLGQLLIMLEETTKKDE